MFKRWYDGEATSGDAAAAAAAAAAKGDVKGPVLADDFDFSSVLPEDLKGHKSLEKYGTHKGKAWAENVARGLVSAQGMIGADPNELVRVPVDPSKMNSDERKAAMQRFGLPKDEKAYVLKAMDKTPVGYEADGPLAKWFTKAAMDAGVFPDQMQKIYEGFGGQLSAAVEAQRNATGAADKANIEGLQKEFGKAFDGEVKAAKFGITALAKAAGVDGTELVKKINDAGLGADPVFFKAMSAYGKSHVEGTEGGDKNPLFSSGVSPAEALRLGTEKLQEANKYLDTNPAKARELNLEAQKLFAQAA